MPKQLTNWLRDWMDWRMGWLQKLRTIPALMILPWTLLACAGSGPLPAPIEINLAPALARECNDPVSLPNTAITQAEVERGWEADRRSLLECAAIVEGLHAILDSVSQETY